MLEELFDDLYRLLRGSTAATSLVDAKSFYSDGKIVECVSLLETTSKRYAEARETTLNKDLSHVEKTPPSKLDKETKRLVRKQDKAHDVLDQMQELIDKIRRNSRLSEALPQTPKPPLPKAKTSVPKANHLLNGTVEPVAIDPMESLRTDFLQAKSFDEKQAVVESHCEVRAIESASTIHSGDLLLAISDGQHYLLQVDLPALEEDSLRIRSATDGTKLRPLPLEKVKRSIAKSKLHLLALKRSANYKELDHSLVQSPDRLDSNSEFPSESACRLSQQQRDQILDSGAFSQLIDAAQRTGIVPGIAMIIQVRDCEFRLGKHHQALQLMESQLSAFVGSAMQRTQKLKREEQDIASGKVKMSPKDMLAKKARDNKEAELIERARTRFTRVLEGIRAIIHLENELQK